MEAAIHKTPTTFLLSSDLVNRLKSMAKGEHSSLNSYVERILLNIAYSEPNADTLAAIDEARSGKLRNMPELDLSSIEAMEKSMGL